MEAVEIVLGVHVQVWGHGAICLLAQHTGGPPLRVPKVARPGPGSRWAAVIRRSRAAAGATAMRDRRDPTWGQLWVGPV